MKKTVRVLTWKEVYERLKNAPPGRLYGVPRGGSVVAGLTGRAVDSFEDCDFVIDDIIDGGDTRREWQEKIIDQWHNGKGTEPIGFWALVDKVKEGIHEDVWIRFPWEVEAEDHKRRTQ